MGLVRRRVSVFPALRIRHRGVLAGALPDAEREGTGGARRETRAAGVRVHETRLQEDGAHRGRRGGDVPARHGVRGVARASSEGPAPKESRDGSAGHAAGGRGVSVTADGDLAGVRRHEVLVPRAHVPWSIRIRRAVVPRRFRRHHLRDAVLRLTGPAREAAVAHLAKLLARAQSAPQRDGREERVSFSRALRARLAHRALLRGEGRVGVFRVFHARGDCFARTKVLAESSGRRRARPRGVAEAGRRRGAAGGFRETKVVARAAVRRPLCVPPHPERHQAVSVRDDLAAFHVRGERHGRERAVLVAQ